MILFNNDYSEGALPEILERLTLTNWEQTPGYSEDAYCQKAADLLRQACQCPQAAVHFLVGGTQTNLTFISAVLRPHQCAVTVSSGHINVHETGAIEATGHKVMALPSQNGKITAAQIQKVYDDHYHDETHEHIAQPKLVYISQPTELGTLYRREELQAIADICHHNGLLLYLDGARLGYALAAADNDVTLTDIARCCDAFYIGGTKVGALFGEALLIVNPALQHDFRYLLKQRGGMLAKGRHLGLQFETLFRDGLYQKAGSHGIAMAMLLKQGLLQMGIPLLIDSTTNQQYPILPDQTLAELAKHYGYSYWQRVDESHSAVRFCTCWATKEENVRQLLADLAHLQEKGQIPAAVSF